MPLSKQFAYTYGWLFVRPRRWLFWKMIADGSFQVRWLPKRVDYSREWRLPNPHWVAMYWTVFKFFKWLNYDAWRHFCKWDKVRQTYPLIARAIHRIGQTTAGFAISGGECFHCSSKAGCQVVLSEDKTGTKFILEDTWTEASMDGTDYRFRGVTICPVCGYKAEYEDGSL